MEEQFVPHSLALELRDLGFEEKCLGYYVDIDPKVLFLDEVLVPETNFKLTSKVVFRAPLWQQAFDWLRDKHSIWVSVLPVLSTNELLATAILIQSWKFPPIQINGSFCYTDDREEALQEALKLIKNEK